MCSGLLPDWFARTAPHPVLLRLRRGDGLVDGVVGRLAVVLEPGAPDVVDRRVDVNFQGLRQEPLEAVEPEVPIAVDHVERGVEARLDEDHGPAGVVVAPACIANGAVEVTLVGAVLAVTGGQDEHLRSFDFGAAMVLAEPQIHRFDVVRHVEGLLVRVPELASPDVRRRGHTVKDGTDQLAVGQAEFGHFLHGLEDLLVDTGGHHDVVISRVRVGG